MARFAIDKMLTLDHLRFHYRDWDGHGWPVLLLHGLASTSHIWDLVAPQIEGARIIALDLRGHGQSDKPDDDYSYQTIVADVRGVMAEVSLERPVIVGHSWGANVGLWLATHHPEEVAGLLMVDGGLVDLGQSMTWEETLQRLKPPTLDGMPVSKFREMIANNTPEGLLTPEVETAILANFLIDGEERIFRRLPVEYHLRILRSMWETRTGALLETTTCPVRLIMARWQGREDPKRLEAKVKAVEEALSRLADGEIEWFDETIHDIPLQRPKELADFISRFVREEV